MHLSDWLTKALLVDLLDGEVNVLHFALELRFDFLVVLGFIFKLSYSVLDGFHLLKTDSHLLLELLMGQG